MINKKVALRIWLILVLIVSSVIIFNNVFKGTPLIDFTYNIENTYRIYKGMVPYKDTFLVLTPGSYYLQVLFFKIFNASNLGLIVLLIIDHVIRLGLLYAILTKITKKTWLTGILLLAASLSDATVYPFSHYNFFCATTMMLYVWYDVRFLNKESKGIKCVIAGILLTLPFLFKQNYGLFFGIGVHIVWLFRSIESKDWKKYLLVSFGTIISALLFIVFLFANGINLMEFLYPALFFSASKKGAIFIFIAIIFMIVEGPYIVLAMFTPLMSFLVYFTRLKTKTKEIMNIVCMFIAWFFVPNFVGYFMVEHNLWYLLSFVCLFIWINEYLFKKEILTEKSSLFLAFFSIMMGYCTHGIVGSFYILAVAVVIIIDIYSSRMYKQVIYVIMIAMIGYNIIHAFNFKYPWIDEAGELHTVSDIDSRLYGIGIRGKWLPEFENLVEYINEEIGEDTFFEYPCEDPVYWATDKEPQLSYFQLLGETCPFSKDETIDIIAEKKISYVIVKREHQYYNYLAKEENIEEDIAKFLTKGYEIEKELGIYTILKNKNNN